MTRKISLLLLLILMSSSMYAQQITQQFSFSQNDVQVVKSGEYDIVSLPGTEFLQGKENAGKPQLPVKHFKLLLPQGAVATDVIITVNSENQLQGSFYLYPVQLPIYPGYEAPPPFVEPDLTIYNSNNPYPSNYVFNYETNGFRDYNYVSVNFTPFRYIPLNRSLYLLTKVTVTVSYTVNTQIEQQKLRPYGETDVKAYNMIKTSMVNALQTDNYYTNTSNKILQYQASAGQVDGNRGFTPTELPALEGSPVHYVIITNNTDVYGNYEGDFTNKFQQLADWKTQSGTPAKVITVDAIRDAYPGVDIAEKIREFIKDAHKLWGTEYILLGGNASIVPVRWIGNKYMPTDLYYSAIWSSSLGYNDNWNAHGDATFGDGNDYCDFTPDIAVGRAPVDTEAEVDLFNKKNFTYYRCSFAPSIPDGAWLNKQLNLQGITFETPWNDPSNGLKHSFNIIQNHHLDADIYGMFEYYNNWLNVHHDWCPAYYPTDANGCTNNQVEINDEYLEHDAVINQLNQRYGIINHFEHSGPLGLGLCAITNSTTGLRASDFQNLNETNKYGIFISGGCETVPIEDNYYISEQWLNATNGGVAFIGTSISIAAYPSFSYNGNFFNSLYTSNIHHIGLTNNFTSLNSSSTSYLYLIMQLLGDPELSIYTQVPVTMNVTHVNTISTGNSDFNVSVTGFPAGETVEICLYKENEVYAFTETTTGTATFNITPDTPGEMKLTVTCHNTEPYETVINVTQNPGVHLYKSDLTILDENGNGSIEPGEVINLSIELSNTGMQNANGISGVLSSSEPNTVISQNTSTYPDIASGQSGTSLVNFTFTAPTIDVFNGKAIPFELNITSNQGSFTEDFFLNIKSSKLDIGNRSVLVNGTESNIFNPNDIAELYVDITNYGTITANNLTAVLSTNLSSDIISINTGTQAYGDIGSFVTATNSNPFIFTVGPDYNGEELLFNLAVTDAFGKTDVFELNLTEPFPELISGFDFSSGKNNITLYWEKVDNAKGYNVYRSNTETGSYDKLNQFLVTGTTMFYDPTVEELSEYYYKISAVSITGNERNFDELVANRAWTSLDEHSIFPISTNNSVANGSNASVTVADVDGDATKELFPAFTKLRDGIIMGFYETGQELFNIDGNETTVSGFAKIILPEDDNGSTDGGELWSATAVGDVDNDGHAEVFVTTNGNYYATKRGYLFGFKTVDLEEPVNHPDPLWNGNPIDLGHRSYSSPVLADLDGDGSMEIITNQERQKIEVYNYSGNLLWDKQIGENIWYSFGYIAVADLNNDGYKEIIIGTKDPGAIYIFNYDGSDFNGTNPIYTDADYRFDANPVIADIDDDGEYEILITARKGNNGKLYAFNTDGSFVNGKWDGQISLNFVNKEYSAYLTPQPAVGDIDNDGQLEIAIADKNKVYLFDDEGNNIQGFPVPVNNLDFGRSSPVLADIDSDDEIEIIIISSNNRIYAFNPDGTECVGWRLPSNSSKGFAGTPTIADIDNDGLNEIIISDANAETYVWNTTGSADKIEWGSYRANSQNTGAYKIECNFSNNHTIEINEANTVWNTNKHIQGNLIINPNADLTIHSKITFVKDSKIIIKQGAKLTIDGGILTNICGNHWQGIQVWGDKNHSQNPDANGNYAQGYLELKNGAVIENAVCAVDLWKPDDWSSTGGIVYADNVTFRNNAKSVHALYYHNYNPYDPTEEWEYSSNFKNCTFEITADYPGTETFYKHVDLSHVNGIDFQHCDFSVADNVNGVATYNIGIAGYDAQFKVTALCSSQVAPCPEEDLEKCTFTGFYRGISALNDGGSPVTFYVDNANFINNAYGVKTRSMDNATVLFSDFEIGEHYCDSGIKSGAGINSDNVTGFAYEENNFSKYTGGPQANYFGIVINDSKDVNEVYKNSFTGLSYANFADGINWLWNGNPDEDNRYKGLAYYCNQNSNNYADFYVSENRPSGIQAFQGSDNNPAGNTFTQNGATWHFYNGGEHLVQYFYNQNAPNEIPDPTKVNDVALTAVNDENGCPSHYGNDIRVVLTAAQKADAEQTYYDNLSDYNNIKTLYDSYKDGGSTSDEELDIETAQPDDMWALRSQLLGDSPHLSFDVLKKAADKTDVFTESALFDILAANPDELRKDTLISYLENKEQPLPDYMIDLLKQLAEGTTYKTALQEQMADYKHAYTGAALDIVRSILNDTVMNDTLLRNWLDNIGGINSDRQIISSYISEGDFTDAYTLANMLPNLYGLHGADSIEHLYYMDLLNLQDTLYQQGRNTYQLDSAEKTLVENIAASSNDVAGSYAKSILEAVYNDYYPDCPEVNNTAGYKHGNVINSETLGKIYGLDITVKPNPAGQWAAFDYTLPKDETNATITITNAIGSIVKVLNVTGHQGQKLFDTRSLSSGIYLYTLKSGQYTKSGKMVIQK